MELELLFYNSQQFQKIILKYSKWDFLKSKSQNPNPPANILNQSMN
mgnify:CR=1 FL=1